jgi:hypothetical protein
MGLQFSGACGQKRRELKGAIFGLSCVCEASENVTPAGRDKAVPHYGQRKLVGQQKFQA